MRTTYCFCGLKLISFPGLEAVIRTVFYSLHYRVSFQIFYRAGEWCKLFQKPTKWSPLWIGQKVKVRFSSNLAWWHNLQLFSYMAVFLIVVPWIWTSSRHAGRTQVLCSPMPVRQEVGTHGDKLIFRRCLSASSKSQDQKQKNIKATFIANYFHALQLFISCNFFSHKLPMILPSPSPLPVMSVSRFVWTFR